MQSIEYYTDYREFLRDFYESKKSTSPAFSYRYFCRKAGLKSPSVYKETVEGKRNLTIVTIPAFINGLGLSDRDGRFFENLVHFNQAKNEVDQKRYLSILRGLRYFKSQKVIPIHLYDFYEKWYNPVIRELAVTIYWNNDFSVLAKAVHPAIKTSEAREAIDLLLRLGFIHKNSENVYTLTDPNITTGPEVNSLAVREMNRQFAKLGLEAIDRFPPSQRDISSVVLSIPQSKIPLLKQELREFRKKMIYLATCSEHESVQSIYSLVLELFPVARTNNDEVSDAKND